MSTAPNSSPTADTGTRPAVIPHPALLPLVQYLTAVAGVAAGVLATVGGRVTDLPLLATVGTLICIVAFAFGLKAATTFGVAVGDSRIGTYLCVLLLAPGFVLVEAVALVLRQA
jgi:hypothetical protein